MDSMVDEGPKVFQIGIRLMVKNAIAEPGIVWKRVQTIFTEFCTPDSNGFSRASAHWMTEPVDATSLKPHELLVYLVKGPDKSLIKHHYPKEFAKNPPDKNTLGLTAPNQPGGNLSEVYFAHEFLKDEPIRIADVIIHELMHNKLNRGDDMHSFAPFSGAEGGFMQDSFPALSDLAKKKGMTLHTTGVDVRSMALALPKARPQKANI